MDQVIIPPASASTTGFIAGDNHGDHHSNHGHHGDHDWPSRTAERVKDALSGFERDHGEQTRDLLAAINSDSKESLISFSYTQKQIGDAATATVVGFKDAAAIAYQVEGRALLEAAKNANAVAVQNTANFNAIQVEQVKNAAAAELRAATIAAAAAAQAAECCCELKALIKEENEKTRDLINANTVQGLRDALAAAQRFIPLTVTVPIPS